LDIAEGKKNFRASEEGQGGEKVFSEALKEVRKISFGGTSAPEEIRHGDLF